VSLSPLDGDEGDACGTCEHERLAHYEGGCEICDDVELDCPGFSEPDDDFDDERSISHWLDG